MRSAVNVLVVVVLAGACAPDDTPPEPTGTTEQCLEGWGLSYAPSPRTSLKILSVNPSTVYLEGQDIVTVVTENGCGKDKLSITVDGEPVVGVRSTDLNTYTFTPPARALGVVTPVALVLTCSAPPYASYEYACNKATAQLTYDPGAEPAPTIKSYAPMGDAAALLAPVVVTFTRRIDPATVTAQAFGIRGLTGTIAGSDDARTFTFTPDSPLAPATTYRAFVMTDVRSAAAHKPLRPTVAAHGEAVSPDADEWTFATERLSERAPTIEEYGPKDADGCASVDAKVIVRFSTEMDPTTITKAVFGVVGVAGGISVLDADRTFAFTPASALTCGATYVAFVTTDAKSKSEKKALRTSVAPRGMTVDPTKDAWSFTTCSCP